MFLPTRYKLRGFWEWGRSITWRVGSENRQKYFVVYADAPQALKFVVIGGERSQALYVNEMKHETKANQGQINIKNVFAWILIGFPTILSISMGICWLKKNIYVARCVYENFQFIQTETAFDLLLRAGVNLLLTAAAIFIFPSDFFSIFHKNRSRFPLDFLTNIWTFVTLAI